VDQRRVFQGACGVGGAIGALTISWIVFQVGGEAGTALFANITSLVIPTAAGVSCWIAGRGAIGRQRHGWRFLGVACFGWAGGQAAWTWYEQVVGIEVPFPSGADIGYLSLIPAAAIGVLLLAPIQRAAMARHVVDGLVVAGSLLFVSWILVLADTVALGGGGALATGVLLAYPLGDVVVLSVVLLALSRVTRGERGAFTIVAAGLACIAVADSGFLYLIQKDLYASGNPIDAGWILGFILLGLGAVKQATTRPEASAEVSHTPTRGALAIPATSVVVAIVFAAFRQLTRGELDPFLIWTAIGVITLVVARHAAALFEVSALTRGLEAKVQERTGELVESERRFRSLIANSTDVIVILDPDATIQYASESVRAVFGHSPQALTGTAFASLVHPHDRVDVIAACDQARGRSDATLYYRMRHHDGTWRHVESAVKDLTDEPSVGGLVVNTRDVTERFELEEELTHRAFHDALTGLPNRALFTDRVSQAIARAARRATPVTVLYLDLDGFKAVNDTFGHAVGDSLLVRVAERLGGLVRTADTVARFGGDEFCVLLDDDSGAENAFSLGQRILSAFEEPFEVEGRDLVVSPSVGLASTASGLETAGDLLRNADVSMYRAKSLGRGRLEVFDPAMHEAVRHRLDTEADLRGAIDRDELVLHYQPIVALREGNRICGAEALLRWQHPTRGLVGPTEFIKLAEESGLIAPIGRWVLRQACLQLRRWREDLGKAAPDTISVNVSARQFRDPDLVEHIAAALRDTVEPSALTVELTESFLMDDPDEATAKLEAIKALGVTIAIDDFGTGYSSLSYLRKFPIDILKIDRVFVESVATSVEDAALAQAIVKLGRTFGMKIVGEGVETSAQAAALARMGCECGQGYLFARPLPTEEFEVLARRSAMAPARV